MESRTHHLPPELIARDGCLPSIRDALRRWKGRNPAEPRLAESKLPVCGFGPEHEYHRIRARLPPVKSPHGLLFRTEDNLSFAVKVFSRWGQVSLERRDEGTIRSLDYFSVRNQSNGHEWTPTIPRLSFTLAGYGDGWEYHFSTGRVDSKVLSILGLEMERRRVLLLAISPRRNPLFRGIDLDELVVRDPISLRNILILNDNPALVRRIIDAENDYWPLSPEISDRVWERFERLERADPFAGRR